MARILQIVMLVGVPVGAFVAAGVGGLVVAVSLAAGYVGIALEGR